MCDSKPIVSRETHSEIKQRVGTALQVAPTGTVMILPMGTLGTRYLRYVNLISSAYYNGKVQAVSTLPFLVNPPHGFGARLRAFERVY